MENPKHQKTMTVFFRENLDSSEVSSLSDELVRLEGVEDAVVVSDGVAYLKVLSTKLDDNALERLKQQYS
ncbi:hypothetical protein A3765_27645 [Oleiphilus sp. HI0130]|nr:hypothetical protein A3765_27645 [Oleiphilus sp. HI0130]